MKLKIVERIILIGLLPTQGTEEQNDLMASIIDKVAFSDKSEISEKQITFNEDGSISFSAEKDSDGKECTLSIKERSFLLDVLAKLNEAGSIKRESYPIYKELKRKLNED